MEPFQMILFLFHMFHMCFLVSTVITMTCWSMNPCYDVIITSIPGTSQQYGDGDALEISEFHRWAKDDPNQARPAVTRCDHDGVSCGLSQFHCVECLALLPNKTSLPLDKAASNPTAIGESNCSLLSNCVDYFLFLEEAFHPCCFFKSRTRRVIISLEEQSKTF